MNNTFYYLIYGSDTGDYFLDLNPASWWNRTDARFSIIFVKDFNKLITETIDEGQGEFSIVNKDVLLQDYVK